MAKWYGNIGFTGTTEVEEGIWAPQSEERPYYGEIIRNNRRFQNSGGVNDNINISNQISIIADSYANQNLSRMTYVEFMGSKWKITDIDIQYPRLIISLGGVYNG